MQVAIQVSELRFATEDGVLVLDDISFGVPREGFVLVVGPPSSGKTLLLKLILRELPPSGGQILLIGRNVARLSAKKVSRLRRRVGYVPEDPPILEDRTVVGNLLFKLRALGLRGEELEEELERALDLTQLAGLADEPAGELPPLEQARLAVALAICPQPVVLLADDPFRPLSAAETERLMDTLLGLQSAGVALLTTTRNAELPERFGFPPHPPKGEESRGTVYLRQGVGT